MFWNILYTLIIERIRSYKVIFPGINKLIFNMVDYQKLSRVLGADRNISSEGHHEAN